MPDLLLELLSEEIPARMQAQAAEDLKRLIVEALGQAQLPFESAQAHVTPRRLVVAITGLPERQADVREERRGPRADAPEKAIEGFLRANGLSRAQIAPRETPKGTFFFAVVEQRGRETDAVLADLLPGAINRLPWPKSMRWGSHAFRWVRPLHGVACVFDGRVVPFAVGPVTTGSETQGHRFLAPASFKVLDFAGYCRDLEAAKVVLDRAERKRRIVEQTAALAQAEGLHVRADPGLLEEVAGLVEWPVVRLGRIDPAFMDVPPEVLTTAMRTHQKYFSLETADGALAPRFALVANIEGADGGAAIVAGNERVLRARLADAKFFWDHDRARPLIGRVDALGQRIFHARLGSDLERSRRIAGLARALAPMCGADPDLAERAGLLCKADLTTDMVGEFPELQGVMGRYYARLDGEPAAVADAIGEHYAPQGPGDRCPTAPVAVAVALADKLDTLAGFFGIGEKPTGSRDPFALRRAALGIIRLVVENRLRLPLRPLLIQAAAPYALRIEAFAGGDAGALADELLAFMADRLKVHLKGEGVRHDLIAAVFAGGTEDDLVRLLARVDALRDFLGTDDGANLLTAFKRASNIVRIEESKDGVSYAGEAAEGLLSQAEEVRLFHALSAARDQIAEHLRGEAFGNAMAVLAGLRPPVDAVFDHVTVNCADAKLRANRLRLLSQIRSALTGVADFSQIEG